MYNIKKKNRTNLKNMNSNSQENDLPNYTANPESDNQFLEKANTFLIHCEKNINSFQNKIGRTDDGLFDQWENTKILLQRVMTVFNEFEALILNHSLTGKQQNYLLEENADYEIKIKNEIYEVYKMLRQDKIQSISAFEVALLLRNLYESVIIITGILKNNSNTLSK